MVQTRIIGFSLAFWAMVALPALCMAGAIGHSCDCGIAAECEHEADCSSDPCGELTARRPGQDNDLAKTVPLPITSPLFVIAVSEMGSFAACEGFVERAPATLIPYLPGDLPLLV